MTPIGYSPGIEWIKRFFIEKADLFLKVLNARWKTAEQEAEYIARALEDVGLGPGSTILDIGCGNGRIAINLAKRGYRVTGVDISPVFIGDARARARGHGVADKTEFVVGDAMEIDRVLAGRGFDAGLMYWTTIIGYYASEEADVEMLRRIRRVIRPGGLLLILNHASLELLIARSGLCGLPSIMSDIDGETVLVENPELDPARALLRNTWVFYRREGRDLRYIDEVSFTLRIYGFHEIVGAAEKAGWSLYKAYRDLASLRPYRPGPYPINIVLKNSG